mgnify:CR=1 FL=1
MPNTIFAKKVGMTAKFTPDGARVGATVLQVLPMKVMDLRTKDKHQYNSIRFKVQDSRFSRIREVRTDEKLEPGAEIKDVLKVGDVVRVSGTSKGKGFAGAVKRHGFAGGPRTHGQSDRERAPGSSGSTTTPGRVYKGKRRAGHMGNVTVTVTGLRILDINGDLITVVGSVPGVKNRLLEVRKI